VPYNYFCCRRHVPPVKYSTKQPDNMPGVLASPKCPTCHRTMELYNSGNAAADVQPVPPVPPPLPNAPVLPKISSAEIAVYSGSGMNPGHEQVTWEITRNAAQMDMTIKLMLGYCTAGNWGSVKHFKVVDGLLNTSQGGAKEDWWLNAPLTVSADKALWHSFNLGALIGAHNLGTLPATIEIGVKLGNAAFGLIHLLAGHDKAVRNVGPYTVASLGEANDDVYRTMLSLQSGMRRFDNLTIAEIHHDPAKDKLLIKGTESGFIVVTRTAGSPRYAITTVYNTQSPTFGNKIYAKTK
jgi:hypothetical protein